MVVLDHRPKAQAEDAVILQERTMKHIKAAALNGALPAPSIGRVAPNPLSDRD
jgi:hypothetical protein